MIRVLLLAMILAVPLTPGCASTGKGGFLSGLFTVKAADKIQAAEKITGVEKADVKLADAALLGNNLQANKTDIATKVGGNYVNDAELMKAYIEANKSAQASLITAQAKADARFMRLLYLFITSLFTLIFRYELQIRKLTNRLLDLLDQDNQKDEARLDKALEKRRP